MIPIRDENPTRSIPFLTISIIILNTLIFLFEFTGGSPEQITLSYGLIPANLLLSFTESFSVEPFRNIFTSMFLHGGLFHILGNMWFLWIFGNNIEDAMGHTRFLLFYVLCGTGAAISQVAVNIHSDVPMVGASGAISGVLGAYLLLYPQARVLTIVPIFYFIRLIYVPASIFILLWFLVQILSSLSIRTDVGGVAWFAHIGGFITGIILLNVMGTKKGRRRTYNKF